MSAMVTLTQTDIEILLSGGTPKCMIPERSNPCKISTRRFSIEILERDGSFVESYEGITQVTATRIRNEKRKEGFRVNVTEVTSVTEAGMTLSFPAIKPAERIVGKTQFATPTFTPARAAYKVRATNKLKKPVMQDGRNVEHPTEDFVILAPLFNEYMARKGFTVFCQGKIAFQGSKEYALNCINNLIAKGFDRPSISIMNHATNKIIQL